MSNVRTITSERVILNAMVSPLRDSHLPVGSGRESVPPWSAAGSTNATCLTRLAIGHSPHLSADLMTSETIAWSTDHEKTRNPNPECGFGPCRCLATSHGGGGSVESHHIG